MTLRSRAVAHNIFGTRDQFHERQLFHRPGLRWGWFGMIQVRYVNCDFISIIITPGFTCGSAGKESTFNMGDLGSISRSGRFPGEGNGNPLQYFCLENSMDRAAAQAAVHGIAEPDIHERATNFHFHNSTSDHQALDLRGWGPLL